LLNPIFSRAGSVRGCEIFPGRDRIATLPFLDFVFPCEVVIADCQFVPDADIRFRTIDRNHAVAAPLDKFLPPEHPARLVVSFADALDFSPLYSYSPSGCSPPSMAVYMPAENEKKESAHGKAPYQRKCRYSKALGQCRERMGPASARALYRLRAPVAEAVHAQQSNRGWKRFRLRSLLKADTEALWQALAHNVCVLLRKKWLGKVGIIRPQLA
jgi:hypothetical protein